jgi:hypothetical protein
MMVDCQGACRLVPGAKTGAHYLIGGRRYLYCKLCNMSYPLESHEWFDSIGRAICPCCGRILRAIPRKPQSKVKYMMMFKPMQAVLYVKAR